jgi:DNA mismatch repair protein MSH6
LDNQTFRIAKDKTSGKRRRIQDDDDDDSEQEAEFSMDEGDDDESAYEQEENTGNDDDDDDQWMVTDDEDDQEVVSGRSKAKKQKTDKKKMSAPKKSSSSLGSFAAPSSFTVTEHGTGKTPVRTSPATSAAFTPKQITPATGGPFSTQRKTPVLTPSLTSTSSSPSASSPTVAKPPMFVKDALNPAGSHVHHHLPFLRRPRDARDRDPDHPEYDPRTLKVVESDWKRVTGKPMTDAVKQWWDLKAQYFDTVLLFKTGTYYQLAELWQCAGLSTASDNYGTHNHRL